MNDLYNPINSTSQNQVTLIDNTTGDICVVNSARVSFSKESNYDQNGALAAGDQKLLNYLASHAHWTPFSHVRNTFAFNVDTFEMDWFIQAVTQDHLAGIVMTQGTIDEKPMWFIRHSLYGWIKLLEVDAVEYIFQPSARQYIIQALNLLYPGSMSAFKMDINTATIELSIGHEHVTIIDDINEDDIVFYDEDRKDYFIDYTLREEVPIYVARQRFKHMVGFTYNEVSRRYVNTEPTYYIPTVLRGRADNKKQGSTDDPCNNHDAAMEIYTNTISECNNEYLAYTSDKSFDVCPEQARGILPQAMITSYYVTGNKAAWKRFITQRLDPHAQKEIRDLAVAVNEALAPVWE